MMTQIALKSVKMYGDHALFFFSEEEKRVIQRFNVGDKVTWENQVGLIVKKEGKVYLCRFPQKNWPFPLEVSLSRQSLTLWEEPIEEAPY